MVGGESFHKTKMINVYDYNGKVWETPRIVGRRPVSRYAHSCVLFGDKIYMYGGVLQNSTVTNELWAFDISAKVWENVTVRDNCNNKTMCGPLKVILLIITSFEIAYVTDSGKFKFVYRNDFKFGDNLQQMSLYSVNREKLLIK